MGLIDQRQNLHKKDWYLPGFFALVVVVVVVSITWRYQNQYLERHRLDLEALSKQVAMTINNDVQSALSYLFLLADAQTEGRLNKETFEERSAAFIDNHPELGNITWADDNFIIRWTAPFEANKQVIGLKLDLPEPKRASHQAQTTGKPVFTRPFTVIQGFPAFEVYVPVFREGKFLGTFGGIFPAKKLLSHATPPDLAMHAYFSIRAEDGLVLAELSPAIDLNPACSVSVQMNPPGFGTKLLVADNHSSLMVEWLLIAMIGLSLGLGILLTLGKLKIQMAIREQAEQAAARSEARLRSIYQAVQAGVLLQAADGKILHANQVACDIFGMSIQEVLGKTSIDPVWHMVDEDGNNIPGEEHPSMITLRTGRPIDNVVYGLFADVPQKMIWLSISTQPIFAASGGPPKEVLVTFHDITSTKHLQADLKYLTIHDHLTGLLNRRFLEEEAAKEIARADRYQSKLSFLMIDIDHFKKINDQFGHRTGDKALCTLADHLGKLIRESDYLARFGGEEFLLILPDTSSEKALSLAEKLRQYVAQMPIPRQGKEPITMTISIGVSTFPKNGKDWETLFKAADLALYRAKELGRNRVEVADPEQGQLR